MPRFFFNIYDGAESIDRVGTDLPNLDAARKHALRTAGRVLAGEAEDLDPSEHWQMVVKDDDGRRLFVLSFNQAGEPPV